MLYDGGQLINSFPGLIAGWYSDSLLMINSCKETTILGDLSKKLTGTYLVSKSGTIDSRLQFPSTVFNPFMISDSEVICSDDWPMEGEVTGWSIFNVYNGKKCYSTRQSLPGISPLVAACGKDLLVYSDATKLNKVNWRQNQLNISSDNIRHSKRPDNFISINGQNIIVNLSL